MLTVISCLTIILHKGGLGDRVAGYPLKLHFQIPCVFPVFSLSVGKFSLCQFMLFVTITYTKLIWQASNIFRRFSQEIWKYLSPLESGNLQLEQTKFPVFW